MTTRKYSSRSQQTTLTSAVTSGAVTLPVVSATTLLGGVTVSTGQTFTVVIDPDTALEEIVDVTVVSGNNLTITRAVDMAGGSAQDHSSGAVVRHMVIGRDLREANLHIEATSGYNDGTGTHLLHGISSTSAVVGTYETQTLYNKTLVAPTLTSTLENDAGITFEGATADAYETLLTVVDPTQDNTITLPNTTGTVDIIDAVQTLTNKTITSPTINGTPVITGLSSAGMVNSSATPKIYVDAILGSATAASTSASSAATSASSAATSATSAATSASLALTSANSAATSATAAATSATSAAASATAASTSATSAAASATAAATSASSAAAATSAVATSAASALTSQTAAATSATSAAASATAAATSASSAATSATAAATSATSAATTYTAYDVRYLGSKATAPTLDNQGGALITGATYWNSTASIMYAWSGSAWSAISTTASYSAPTLGSTTIASGTTYANVAGLTINSTTIPTSATLTKTADKLSVFAATTSAELAGVISDETGTGQLVFATLPTFGTSGVKLSGSTSGTTQILSAATAGTSVITLPTGTDTLVGKATTDTLTNKTLTAPVISSITNTGTITLPTATTTLVGTDTTDTLTNKTLTDPKINQSINAQTGTTYTFVLSDNGKFLTASNASAQTYSIPTNASVAFPVGTSIDLIQIGAGQVTVTAVTSGTTTILSNAGTAASPKARAQYSAMTCKKVATDTWYVIGDIA